MTVTALHEATGNTFVAVTNERGIYRIPARVGSYRINAVLQGFATSERTGIQLLAGQTSTICEVNGASPRGDERHRLVLNGIWQIGHGFQLSGIHYASAGDRSATSYGTDLRNLGAGSVERQRLRPDGCPQYLKRTAAENRTMQFGFRITF